MQNKIPKYRKKEPNPIEIVTHASDFSFLFCQVLFKSLFRLFDISRGLIVFFVYACTWCYFAISFSFFSVENLLLIIHMKRSVKISKINPKQRRQTSITNRIVFQKLVQIWESFRLLAIYFRNCCY